MANDYIGIRMGLDLRAQVEHACISSGMTLSEWVRMACIHVLNAGAVNEAAFASEGYRRGRELAFSLLRFALNETANTLPMTYEEALIRYPRIVEGSTDSV